MRSLWIFLVILIVTGSVVVAAPKCDNGEKVTITIGKTLTVSPKSVEIFVDASAGGRERVCWFVEGLTEDLTVRLGPKYGSADLLPNRERAIKLPRTFANSGRPAKSGVWTYAVWVARDGDVILEVDPEVIIREKRGGN